MPEHPEHKPEGKTTEATLGLIVVVSTFMYTYNQLLSRHMLDVLIAVIAFGIGLVLLYRYFK